MLGLSYSWNYIAKNILKLIPQLLLICKHTNTVVKIYIDIIANLLSIMINYKLKE